jgi:hypothetical protein
MMAGTLGGAKMLNVPQCLGCTKLHQMYVCCAMKNATLHVMAQDRAIALIVSTSKMGPSAHQSAPPASMMHQVNVSLATKTVSRLSRQCGILNISQPYSPPRSVTGIPSLYGDRVCFL